MRLGAGLTAGLRAGRTAGRPPTPLISVSDGSIVEVFSGEAAAAMLFAVVGASSQARVAVPVPLQADNETTSRMTTAGIAGNALRFIAPFHGASGESSDGKVRSRWSVSHLTKAPGLVPSGVIGRDQDLLSQTDIIAQKAIKVNQRAVRLRMMWIELAERPMYTKSRC